MRDSAPDLDLSQRERQQFSIRRAILAQLDGAQYARSAGLELEASLSQAGPSGRGQGQKSAVLIHSISETGCELQLRDQGLWALASPGELGALAFPTGGLAGEWPVQLVRTQKRPGGLGIGLAWGALDHREREHLHRFLYRRANLWPLRRAPFDGFALLALGRRLLQRPGPDDWFQRSQLPVRDELAAGP